MTLFCIFVVSCVLFLLAYRFYGNWMEGQLDVMDERLTPAHTMRDGVDYVPTPTAVVFGHHFSSIAGAGPIVGPIAAALVFGWGPALLWIVVGSIFIGGMQDYTAMMASIRHQGRSLAQIGRHHMGPVTYRLFLLFILFMLIYVIIVFMDMTATTFAPKTVGWGGTADEMSRMGGSVATASILTMVLAAVFGQGLHRWKWSLGRATFLMVPLMFLTLVAGHYFPLSPDLVPGLGGSDKWFWSAILLIYCGVASVLPVWALLQPRDYLSSFLLYACLLGGVVGLGVGAFSGQSALTWPMWKGWMSPVEGSLYPALFVMVACGAVSGFHAVMASGTTSKQINREHDAKRVGMGAMLVESVLALLALATVATLAPGAEVASAAPANIFASGIERFFGAMGVPSGWIASFMLLAVSTFLLTTLDSCTRLCRFLFQEMTGFRADTAGRRALSTVLVLIPVLPVFMQFHDAAGNVIPLWKAIWPAFGATNQLLGALALLMVYSWLREKGKRAWFVLGPMLFMLVTTLIALGQIIWRNFTQAGGSGYLGGMCSLLFALALVVLWDVSRRLLRERKRPTA